MISSVFVGLILIIKEIFIKLLVLRKYIFFLYKRGLLFIKRAACGMGEGKVHKCFFLQFYLCFSVILRILNINMDGLYRVLKLPEII